MTYYGLCALALYVATIPVAYLMSGYVGVECTERPCQIPVGFGLTAPSGVLVIGAALVLRDMVQRWLGWQISLVAIVIGGAMAVVIAPTRVVIASVTAFLFSEIADFAVYTPLQRRRFILAVVLSGTIGAIIDSVLFEWLGFGHLDHVAGQVVGKVWVSVAAGVVIFAIQQWFRYKARTHDIHL